MYKPDKILVYDGVSNDPMTLDILSRIERLYPNTAIQYVNNRRPELPAHLDAAGRFHEMKKTLVLSDRNTPFIETFASPGNIVENMGTMIKTVFNCSANCHFCYLQRTAIRQQWQRVYVNLNDLEKQMKNELIINSINKTVLSAYCDYKGGQIFKIPAGFKQYSDNIRNKLTDKDLLNNLFAVDYLKNILADALLTLVGDLDRTIFEKVKANLKTYYKNNQNSELEFNVSEYSDILGIEHIAGHLEYYMKLIESNKEFRIRFFTKFSNVDNLLKYPGHGRVKIVMNLNTKRMIDEYEIDTSRLNERLEALRDIQEAGGFNIRLQFEPIFTYPGDEKEYCKLIDEVFKYVDINRVDEISVGTVRYTKQLMNVIRNNYTDTTLFDSNHYLEAPENSKDRYRYPVEERIRLYTAMSKQIRKHGEVKIKLGAETPEIWKLMDINPIKVI